MSGIQRTTRVRLVVDEQHLSYVIDELVSKARVSIWIATANLKDMMVEPPIVSRARSRNRYVSVLDRFARLADAGVELRLLHASPPSRAFRASLAKRSSLRAGLSMRMCPRNHMKLILVDGRRAYVGSANFTGAGLGAKGSDRRNFEIGVVVDDDVLLDVLQARFDTVWRGGSCAGCRVRASCPQPLDTIG